MSKGEHVLDDGSFASIAKQLWNAFHRMRDIAEHMAAGDARSEIETLAVQLEKAAQQYSRLAKALDGMHS